MKFKLLHKAVIKSLWKLLVEISLNIWKAFEKEKNVIHKGNYILTKERH